MKFTGDPDGITELKNMKETRMDYLKYLVTEARTNFDHAASFKSQDQKTAYKMTLDTQTGEINVQKVG